MKYLKFRNWPLFSKILSIAVCTVAFFFCSMTFVIIPKVETFVKEEKKEGLKNLVSVSKGVIEAYHQMELRNELSREEAQEAAISKIKQMAYDQGNNYFWINDLEPKMVMHPTDTALNGQYIGSIADANGIQIFSEMVSVVRREGGSGYVPYMWPKPGSKKPVEKISYVELHEAWGWVIGTGVYIEDINELLHSLDTIAYGTLAICCLLALVLSIWIAFQIVRPVLSSVEYARKVAKGNFSSTLDFNQEDEVGLLVKELNVMVKELSTMFAEISEGVDLLKESSNSFVAIQQQFSAGAHQSQGKANDVSLKAENMQESMSFISESSSETMQKIAAIVATVEEMNATFNEISKNTENARLITEKAVTKGDNAHQRVGLLEKTVESIGKFTEVINQISEQTNLLALNATIEAASAGDAGKGFAVVAGEIKELARQTSSATEQIKQEVSAIHSSTTETIVDIKEVSAIISEINEFVSSIAGAIEEQTAVTSEIAENVSIASIGLNEVSSKVSEGHKTSESVACDIKEVERSSNEVISGCSLIGTRIKTLSELASKLEDMVSRFDFVEKTSQQDRLSA